MDFKISFLLILFDIILIIGKTPANCIYAVFDIKSDIAAVEQPYIGNDFMSTQFAVCQLSAICFPLL